MSEKKVRIKYHIFQIHSEDEIFDREVEGSQSHAIDQMNALSPKVKKGTKNKLCSRIYFLRELTEGHCFFLTIESADIFSKQRKY